MANETLVINTIDSDRKRLRGYCTVVTRSMDNIAKNILKLSNALYLIREEKLYLIDGYKDISSFASDKFGISKATCYKYIGLREVFGLDSKFSPAQMYILLPYVRKGGDISEITPDMSSREIQRYIKEHMLLSSLSAETDSESNTPVNDIKPKSFVFNITDDLFKASDDVYDAFFSDIRMAVVNAHKKFGAKSIKIVIE